MRGVGPSSRKPATLTEQGMSLPQRLHCAEQLHVHVPPDSWGIEIESTPSAVGTLVGAAVGTLVGAAFGGGAVTHNTNTHWQST